MHVVGYRHVVPKDMVHRLGQPRAGLLGLIVHTGMTWNTHILDFKRFFKYNFATK